MKQFSELVNILGTSTKTNDKLDALSEYFATANDKDKVWVIAIFSGRRPKRAVNSTQLWTWCNELVGLPDWLFEESYHVVGDLAETIALLLPESTSAPASYPLHHYLETLISIEKESEAIRKQFIISSWQAMTQPERFVFNKLITGGFRIGVSQKTMVNAEWKWDGIRGELIKRNNEIFVWSRGEELMTEKFPEYFLLKDLLPNGIVLDGEIIPSIEGAPLPFALLQTRIGRKNVTKKNLQETPITFFAYDLLEYEGNDIRESLLTERRVLLEKIVTEAKYPALLLSPVINFSTWNELGNLRMQSRNMGSEGIMLKRKNSTYQVGRKRGDWWKWKIDPLVIDAVMIYAQKGHGRRSNLYTDYTFAVRDGDKLVSFTKAYSGLTDKEFAEVDSFVKRNAIEKFGPVRTVKPELVFEIAFEGIAASNRHKSGVALRFPRINRWRKDKKPNEINTLDDLKKMLEQYGK